MARKDRMGQRKPREQRVGRRIPELGYYLVVTDTEATERIYFTGLHDSLPAEIKDRLVIKVVETKTHKLIDKCREMTAYEAQYRIPWIVFDRDQVPDFDQIIKDANESGIHVGWSNPCFEIWMFGYFKNLPFIRQSWTCVDKFADVYKKETGQPYDKADADMYKRLFKNGNEQQAIKRAMQKHRQMLANDITVPSQMCPCTTVYQLVDEIKGKAEQ